METRQTTSNLTTVPLEFQQVTIFFDVIPDILGNSYLALPLPLQLGEERAPDFDPLIVVEWPKVYGNIDTRQERFVECPDAVGREQEDPLIVFERTQEDCHQVVTVEVCDRSPFQKDISFIQQ